MLYHRQVSWSERFDKESAELVKTVNHLSKHVQERMITRNFTFSDIMKVISEVKKMDSIKSFEVETDGHKVIKACFRFPYNDKKDIILVCRYGIVVTAWFCSVTDHHKTLDTSKYARL